MNEGERIEVELIIDTFCSRRKKLINEIVDGKSFSLITVSGLSNVFSLLTS